MTVLRASPGWVRTTNICVKEQRGGGETPEQTEVLSPYRWWAKPTVIRCSKFRATKQNDYSFHVIYDTARSYDGWDKIGG